MQRLQPRSNRPYTLLPYATLFQSDPERPPGPAATAAVRPGRRPAPGRRDRDAADRAVGRGYAPARQHAAITQASHAAKTTRCATAGASRSSGSRASRTMTTPSATLAESKARAGQHARVTNANSTTADRKSDPKGKRGAVWEQRGGRG